MTDLIKVVAVTTKLGQGGTFGRGIIPIKARQTVQAFIAEFLESRGITGVECSERTEHTWALPPIQLGDSFISFIFLRFPVTEFRFQARELTEAELERDLPAIIKKFPEIKHG